MVNHFINLLLAISLQDNVLWIGIFIITAVMIGFLFIQQRQGMRLKSELAELSKIQKRNVEYEFVIKAMRVSVWHVDAKTHVIRYEQDFRDKRVNWSQAPDGSTFEDAAQMIDGRDNVRVLASMDALMTGKSTEYHEIYRVPTPYSARPFYWEESFATVAERDVDGTPALIVGTSMRIDERKTMEKELLTARNKAEESDRLKSAFIANMSHEIRTPLNAIVGFTSLLPDISNDEERTQLFGLVQENTQKLLRIMDDVVSISKVEAGQDKPVLTPFELNALLADVTAHYEAEAAPGVKLTTHFASDAETITTDRSRLKEIMKRLVSNAVKFTSQGTVTVGYDEPLPARIRIWVDDTGKGIDKAYTERVFERFFKVDEFVPGAGLGLSVCQTLAESLGGQVGVDSEPGKGSRFWIEIPTKQFYEYEQ